MSVNAAVDVVHYTFCFSDELSLDKRQVVLFLPHCLRSVGGMFTEWYEWWEDKNSVLLTSLISLFILFPCKTKLHLPPLHLWNSQSSKAMNSPGLLPEDSISSVIPLWSVKGAPQQLEYQLSWCSWFVRKDKLVRGYLEVQKIFIWRHQQLMK